MYETWVDSAKSNRDVGSNSAVIAPYLATEKIHSLKKQRPNARANHPVNKEK